MSTYPPITLFPFTSVDHVHRGDLHSPFVGFNFEEIRVPSPNFKCSKHFKPELQCDTSVLKKMMWLNCKDDLNQINSGCITIVLNIN